MNENKRLFVGKKTVEDRFTIILNDDEIGLHESKSGDVLVLKHRDLNSEQFVSQICVFLNDQNQAIEKLWKDSEFWLNKASERIKQLEQEVETLQDQLAHDVSDLCGDD